MCLARLLMKLSKEEPFEEEDWNDFVTLAFNACQWLTSNTKEKVSQETSQARFHPTSKKRGKTKE